MVNEQQRVDVLAVMRFDAESSELGQRRAGVGESAVQARMKLSDAAIAAVAELIEAVIENRKATQDFANDGQPDNYRRWDDSERRVLKALANVGAQS